MPCDPKDKNGNAINNDLKAIKQGMTEYTSIIKQALTNLRIKYREVDLKQKKLLFCRLLTGQTFDISIENDQVIKIWSFVGTVDIEKSGFHYEFNTADTIITEAGIDVTDEGDLCFYAVQKRKTDDKQTKSCVCKIIKLYSAIISKRPSRFIVL